MSEFAEFADLLKISTRKPFSAKAILQLQKRMGLNNLEFCAILGITTQTLWNWKNGIEPSPMANRLLHLLKDRVAAQRKAA